MRNIILHVTLYNIFTPVNHKISLNLVFITEKSLREAVNTSEENWSSRLRLVCIQQTNKHSLIFKHLTDSAWDMLTS